MQTNINFAGRLRMSEAVADKLRAHHLAKDKNVESCSFALGHAYSCPDGERTIVLSDPEAVLLFASDCFVSKSYGHVSLHKDVKAQVFLRAVQEGYTAVVDIHDHHFTADAWFSGTDDRDDLANARYVSKTVQSFMPEGKNIVAAALLITRGTWAARLAVKHPSSRAKFAPLRVDCIGRRLECLSAMNISQADSVDARHKGVIGAAERELMRALRLVVVGGGGTGSIVVEGLLRCGFRNITIIDSDLVEESNLNRLQGCGPADVGLPKAEVLAIRASLLVCGAKLTSVKAMVYEDASINALRNADLILGCVDNRETRWWLNRFSVQYMIPWFDCAVVLHAQPKVFHEIHISSVLPGTLCCGHCGAVEFFPRNRPSLFMDTTSLTVQRAAGYIQDVPEVAAPAAYLVNLQAVGFMIDEIMAWCCGWREPASSLFRRSDKDAIERIDSSVTDLTMHVDCPVCATLLGKCNEEMLPQATSQIDLGAVALHFEKVAVEPFSCSDRQNE